MILRGPHRPDLLKNETLPDLLESTALRLPDKTALIFGRRTMSYSELNTAADRVASRLIQLGIQPGQTVGLWLPRGPDLLVAQAAITKAGAAWLPFDADTPAARIAVCLDDAQSPGLLTCRSQLDLLAECTRPLWILEDLLLPADAPLVRRGKDFTPDCPAYVIYTSGSTGKPKGIAVNHRSICHFLRSENEVLGVRESDRVYQGFSVAFDMSFEEIWISYLAGATLWLAPKEITGDPDALALALESNKISVLHAVPTLLSLFPRDVSGLRLINLGGEMCPQALVERWATPERQLFNTYGPTEATVSASIACLHRGEPVTIGKPLPNYGLLVVDAELKLLPPGETGELCIIGPGVADGYLGRPDLTAEKFVANPYANSEHEARLYHTGDLARIDEAGNVQCLGRVDDQIKIRGYRVELGEIEAVLAKEPGVGTAAVILRNVGEVEQLVAFYVANADTAPIASELRKNLAAQLPPYMVPARFEVVQILPRLTSGKIDRKALRSLPLTETALNTASDLPDGSAETALFSALKNLFPGQPLLRDADFFTDLGGHSLLAARLVSKLREDSRFANVTVHDIYCERRIGSIAAALAKKEISGIAAEPEIVETPRLRRILCSLAQAATIPPLVCMKMAQWLSPFFTYHYFTGDEGDSMTRAIFASLLVYLLANFGSFLLVIAAKWLVVGRLKPGRYPLWGVMYFRWWLADRISEIPPRHLLSGSSLNAMYLRALGAKVGNDALIGALSVRVPDLLSIGNGVSIGSSVNLENARVERGYLILGNISIGNEAVVDSYAVMEDDTAIGDYAHLGGLSSLASGQRVPDAQQWEGSPAHFFKQVDIAARRPRVQISARRTAMETLFYFLGANLVAVVFFLPVFPSFILIDWIDARWLKDMDEHLYPMRAFFTYLLLSIPASAVLVLATVLASAGFRWVVLPRLKEGSWSVHSAVYFGKWLGNQIQESSLFVLHGLYATVYAPWWYRLLGARVGSGTEISTALGVVPDMLTIGTDSFVADGVMLGDERIEGGWMSLRPTVIGNRTFLGNGAFVPDGSVLPDDVLIGVQSSVPANDRMRPGDTWVGNPPIILPAREQFEGFDPKLTFHPSLMRRLSRGFVEGLRIVMPMAVVIAVGYLTVALVMPLAGAGRFVDTALALSLAGFLYGVGSFLFVVLIKWLVVGRYKSRSAPMWTAFVWASEAVTNLYESIAVPNFVDFLRGTPMLPPCMRLLGCKTGRGIYMDTTQLTEFDCVSIGDYAALNSWCGPQTHLFEDRIMKIGAVNIGRGVTIGARSTILYGAHIGDGATLGPLTLILKGENIPQGTRWIGSPAEPWAE
ncbi:MAG: amino acid adenylation domain-containing protein [Proteobacteria bacterium]|nr:amino acid adenylation domain-containing protein [Pseudomonadota bacterium]